MVMQTVFHIILLLCSINAFARAANLTIRTSCHADCGNNVSIPYPFGIGAGICYVDTWFEIVCNNDSSGSPKPFLKKFNLEVLEIQLISGTVRVNYPISWSCANSSSRDNNSELAESPFVFSQFNNSFTAMGCNFNASMLSIDGSVSYGGCKSLCGERRLISQIRCTRTDCCQTTIPSNLQAFTTIIEPQNSGDRIGECKYAFLVDFGWFQQNFTTPNPNMSVPVVLFWGIVNATFDSLSKSNNWAAYDYDGNSTLSRRCYRSYPKFQGNFTHRCFCNDGFEGNPYLPEGCRDIDECADPKLNHCNFTRCKNTNGSYLCIEPKNHRFSIIIGTSTSLGLLFLLIGGWRSYKVVKKRKKIKQREKFFKRNGGLLLQQQLSSSEGHVENNKLFNSKDLEKATDRFNANRVLGQGGQGTVYKGMLTDGRIVAVKKSTMIDEGKLEEFINEVVILSRINHRNVVKLLGCCLETEVPLLVYEFVPNGTLSQYLSHQNEELPPTWDMRLRIATEVARALFYLHSAASSPIYHRDIKSANILLDDKYIAKVADFGTSKSVAIDQTHLTTLVQGTFGYLDPEYFQTSQFTEKSDVYSFGVVLAELLTGEKAISLTRTPETKNLATYFIRSIEENNLFDILDNQVLKEGKKEEIIAVANLAKSCLNLSGKKRPTMKEVARELEAVQMSRKDSNLQQNDDEVEYVRSEMYEEWDVFSTSTTISYE